MLDIFISYRREGGYGMARLLYERFDALNLEVFFDVEKLKSGHFDTKLYESIEEAENFLLMLSPGAMDRCCESEDDWVRLEVEHAIAKNKNIIPIMMPGFTWPENLPDSMKSLPGYNDVRIVHEYFEAAVTKILNMLVGIDTQRQKPSRQAATSAERTENTYFYFEDEKEKKRLKIQQNLMREFDADTYKKAEDEYDELYILDVGSNNGDFIMDRIGKSDKLRLLIGLENDAATVDAANQKYGGEGKIAFYQQNVEDENLGERIEKILEDVGIEKFNLINVSMVILHLKNPYRLLKVLRSYLAKGGMIIIKDIDDGLNLAYPDDTKDFERIINICVSNDTSGYRHSGRQIYTLLKHAGYSQVCLEKMGLSTVGMDYDERAALFDTYFSFILEDLKIMRERYPEKEAVREDYEWYLKNYEAMEERFQDDAFFFTLGFILYTARKK